MKYLYLLIAAIILVTAACKENSATQQEKPDTREEKSDSHAQTDGLKLTLNDGEKWQMDEHTRTMVKTMVDRAEKGGDADAVAKGLKSDLDKLIQGCTMTGAAHDQLHVFLTSFIPAVQKANATPSEESLEAVEALLQKYGKYFE